MSLTCLGSGCLSILIHSSVPSPKLQQRCIYQPDRANHLAAAVSLIIVDQQKLDLQTASTMRVIYLDIFVSNGVAGSMAPRTHPVGTEADPPLSARPALAVWAAPTHGHITHLIVIVRDSSGLQGFRVSTLRCWQETITEQTVGGSLTLVVGKKWQLSMSGKC